MNTDILSNNILFVDIETVTSEAEYEQLSERMQRAWQQKAQILFPDAPVDELYFERGGLYAEFGKIIVISVGFFHTMEDETVELRVKCISGKDELELLENFKKTVLKFDQQKIRLCAHHGKEFDFPYLCRRMLVNGIELPGCLQLSGKKSWEVPHLDTMEMWKFGDYKHFTSLTLLANLFGIAYDDEALEGSEINQAYHRDNNLKAVTGHCQQNISLLAQVYLKLRAAPLLEEQQIVFV